MSESKDMAREQDQPQFLTVRKLSGAADAVRYRALRLECLERYPEQFGSSLAQQAALPVLPFEKIVAEGHPDHFMLGLMDDSSGQCVGIGGFRRPERQRARHSGDLVQVFLQPAYQGYGLGRRLTIAILTAAFRDPEIEQVMLYAVATNKRAIELYTSLGFELVGTIRRNFKTERGTYLDQVIMIKYRTATGR